MENEPEDDDLDNEEVPDDDATLVSQSEAELISSARMIITRMHGIQPCAGIKFAKKVSESCEALVLDALQHIWKPLFAKNKALPGHSIINDKIVEGRLWQRYEPLPLTFTHATLEFIKQLTDIRSGHATIKNNSDELSIGDQLVMYLAIDIAQDSTKTKLLGLPIVSKSALMWLTYPEFMTGDPPSFDCLTHSAGAIIIEALIYDLTNRWKQAEMSKKTILNPAKLLTFGQNQSIVIEHFMTACDKANRRDLAVFVISAAKPFIDGFQPIIPQTLDPETPLSIRAAAKLASGALFHGIKMWGQWDGYYRGVRFFEPNYDIAQFLLRKFEAIGYEGVERANKLLSDLSAWALSQPKAENQEEVIEAAS